MRELTEAEKLEIAGCLNAGRPLPDKYRFLLFEHKCGYELVWDGKQERAAVPRQQLRRNLRSGINPEFARPADKGPRQCARQESLWMDKLIWGDNRLILSALLQEPVRNEINAQGGLKLIYIDPPFCTDADFSMALPSGCQSGIPEVAYRDKWETPAAFLAMIHERLLLMHELLAPDGSIYVHCDWRMNSCLRLMLDEIFGNYVNEICWHYTGGGRSGKYFSRKHDSILVYSKSGHFIFNKDAIRIPYKQTSSYAKGGIRARSGKTYFPHPSGTVPDDVWDIPIINPLARERLGYPTQKPEALLERIIKTSSRPGDLVADFFCGSGTFPAVAAKLGRKWLAADSGRLAILVSRKRLLQGLRETGSSRSFELWSLANGEAYSCVASAARVKSGSQAIHIEATPRIRGNAVAIELLGYKNENGLLPENSQSGWSGLIDYWAVDYNFGSGQIEDAQNLRSHEADFFNGSWHVWRNNPDQALELISPYREAGPGKVTLAVEVVDIFGYSGITTFCVNLPC